MTFEKKRQDMNKKQKQLIEFILNWYKVSGRDLPWRKTKDPYQVLVSEIMLQQTQVTRVIEKWYEFLDTFPTVEDLATGSTADVITVWKGLGYNRRALFLQKTAQAVVGQHGGRFPKDIDALKALPGIGDYTARAVLSFAFDEPVPMMDTNHRKFYNRVFFDKVVSDKELLVKAEDVIAYALIVPQVKRGRSNAWHFNQALMDLMSAVARKDEDVFVQTFIKTYPEVIVPKKNPSALLRAGKKKSIPFKQTNRYIRGRIIDRLREDRKVSKRAMQSQLNEFPKERINENIANLVAEGLIVADKQSILLPTSTK